MEKFIANKRYCYALLGVAVLAVAVIGFITTPHRTDVANAQGLPAVPVVGIQASQGSGSGGCTQKLTNIAYSDTLDYAGSMVNNGSPYGNTDCARIYLSGQGPFTQDFRIGVRMYNPKQPGGWGPYVYTPWAADIATGASAAGWSPWGGAQVNVGSDPGHATYQLTVDTRPLPAAGDTITITNIGLQEGDDNKNSNPPYYCSQPPTPDEQVFTSGGVSTGGKPVNAPAGWSGANDVADCTRVYLGDATLKGAQVTNDNIPANFNVSENKTIGTDGQPLAITVKNNSTVGWYDDKSTVISQAGSCTVSRYVTNGNDCPASTAPAGTTCTSQVSNSSDVYVLKHIGGSFGIAGDPATLNQITTNICKIAANGNVCSNNSPACQNEAACTSQGSCSQGGCGPNNCMVPQQFGGCGGQWTPGCNGTWGPAPYSYVVNGSTGVQPGQSAQFFLNSMTAPAAASTYNESWQMDDALFGAVFTKSIVVAALAPPTVTITPAPGSITLGQSTILTWNSTNATACTASGAWSGAQPINGSTPETPGSVGITTYDITCTGPNGNASASASVTVNAAPVGTITVTSANIVNGNPVEAKWDIVDGANDICVGAVVCQGSSQTYQNQLANNMVTGIVNSIAPLNTSLYGFNSIKRVPLAQKKNGFTNAMLSLARNVFGSTAEAMTIPPSNPLSQFLPSGGEVDFIIEWNPIANISLDQANLPLTSPAGSPVSGVVKVSNSGAPGSKLTWTSSVSPASATWLSVSPSSDGSGLTNDASGNAASENVTIKADSAGLAVGTYTATVAFNGTSASGPSVNPLNQTLTVTYTVTNFGGAGYSCGAGVCSAVGSGAQYGTVAGCDAACGFTGSITGVSVNCNPLTVYVNDASVCTATVNGNGSYSSGVIWSTSAGTVDQSGNYTAPGVAGTATVTATSKQDPTKSSQATITIQPPLCNGAPGCQAVCNPSLTATPSSIVIPESSNLQWNCTHVTQCQLTQGGNILSNAMAGSYSVTPPATTNYALSCVNNNYSNDTASYNTTVTVGGTSRCEQNPNGAGCPGH